MSDPIKKLEQFRSANQQPIFHDARPEQLPQFFHQNLTDDSRIIKIFEHDPQANLRVFFFQYLKLCFEFDPDFYRKYMGRFEDVVFSEDFHFECPVSSDPSIFNDDQLKNLIGEFFAFMANQYIAVEKALNRYPILNQIFVCVFRSILIQHGLVRGYDDYFPRNETIDFLSQFFEVEINFYGDCVKYSESSIFAFQERPQLVFMAYIPLYQAENEQSSEQVSEQTSLQQIQQPVHDFQAQAAKKQGNTEIYTSYIAEQFVDYTNSKNAPTDSFANPKTQPKTEENKQQPFNTMPQKKMVGFDSLMDHNNRDIINDSYGNTAKQSVNQKYPVDSYTTNYQGASYLQDYTKQDNTFERKIGNYQSNYSSLQAKQRSTNFEPKYGQKVDTYTPYTAQQENNYTYEDKYKLQNNNTRVETSTNKFSINTNNYATDYKPAETLLNKYSTDNYNASDVLNKIVSPQLSLGDKYKSSNVNVTDYHKHNSTVSYAPRSNKEKEVRNLLNVSMEFTSDEILAHVNQPSKTAVREIKARARTYRASIYPK